MTSELLRGETASKKVSDVMTRDPVCCGPGTTLHDVASMMVSQDCGEIPVCDDGRRAIGVVTDRDIVCRLVANGRNPLELTARDCMTAPVITCTPDMLLDDCARLMEQYQVRRLPVVDGKGLCCGIVAQADIARKGPKPITAEVIEMVSRPSAPRDPEARPV